MSDVDVERVKAKAMEIVALGRGMPLKEFQGALLIAIGAVNGYMIASSTALVMKDDEKPKEWDQWPRSQD